MKHPITNRITGADTVRALATLGVLAAHLLVVAPQLKQSQGLMTRLASSGYMGVAAFFVLSGFLLSMPFWRAFRAGESMPSLKTYLSRRLARIVPEYFVCVLILGGIAGAFLSKWGWIQILGCMTFTNVLLPATYMPTWDPPLWTIGIEMAFYLMLPIMVVCAFRVKSVAKARLGVLLAIALIVLFQPVYLRFAPHVEQAVGNVSLFSADSSATTKNPIVLFAHFLVGVLAADVLSGLRQHQTCKGLNRYDLLVAATAVLIVAILGGVVTFPSLDYMHYQWPIFPAMIGVLLVSLPKSAFIGSMIESRFLRLTAILSYGIYIWHFPILMAIKSSWPMGLDGSLQYVYLFCLIAVACSYAAAAMSYVLVGRPVMSHVRSRDQKMARADNAAEHDRRAYLPDRYNRYHQNTASQYGPVTRTSPMTQSDMPRLRLSHHSLAADAYEYDTSTHVIEDSLELIEDLGAYNRWVFDLLSPHVTGRVLEVGCGTGNITQFIAQQAEEVVGIDPVARFLDRFSVRFAGHNTVRSQRCTLADLAPARDDQGRFDAVVSCNVFEHIEDHVDALSQVAKHLRPGGKAIIFVPAGPIAFGKLDRELGHYRRYTIASLRQAMQDAGLEWIEGRYSNMVGLFGWWLNSVILGKTTVPGGQAIWFNRLAVPILSRIERFIRPPFGQSVVGVARKPMTAAQSQEQSVQYRRAA